MSDNLAGSSKQKISDDFFMGLAELTSQQSRDPRKQVGACLVDEKDRVIGLGYNCIPRGYSDDRFHWDTKNPEKWKRKKWYVVHAEVNAILNKNLADISGARIYTTVHPCDNCAKLIIQAGIKEVIYVSDETKGKGDEIEIAKYIFKKENMKCRRFERNIDINLTKDSEREDQSCSPSKKLKDH